MLAIQSPVCRMQQLLLNYAKALQYQPCNAVQQARLSMARLNNRPFHDMYVAVSFNASGYGK